MDNFYLSTQRVNRLTGRRRATGKDSCNDENHITDIHPAVAIRIAGQLFWGRGCASVKQAGYEVWYSSDIQPPIPIRFAAFTPDNLPDGN